VLTRSEASAFVRDEIRRSAALLKKHFASARRFRDEPRRYRIVWRVRSAMRQQSWEDSFGRLTSTTASKLAPRSRIAIRSDHRMRPGSYLRARIGLNSVLKASFLVGGGKTPHPIHQLAGDRRIRDERRVHGQAIAIPLQLSFAELDVGDERRVVGEHVA